MALRPKAYRIIHLPRLAVIHRTGSELGCRPVKTRSALSSPTSSYWKITSSSAYWVPASGILSTYIAGSAKKTTR